jgi:NAD(P)-dependent dehydrogenase (short-subunit alcohol dehydrogenase family)
MGGFNLACAAIEALTRTLAGEVGRQGVRVVGIRPGMTDDVPQLVKDTLIDRLPRLAEVGDTAVYVASAGAGAMTGAVVNLSCGAIID